MFSKWISTGAFTTRRRTHSAMSMSTTVASSVAARGNASPRQPTMVSQIFLATKPYWQSSHTTGGVATAWPVVQGRVVARRLFLRCVVTRHPHQAFMAMVGSVMLAQEDFVCHPLGCIFFHVEASSTSSSNATGKSSTWNRRRIDGHM